MIDYGVEHDQNKTDYWSKPVHRKKEDGRILDFDGETGFWFADSDRDDRMFDLLYSRNEFNFFFAFDHGLPKTINFLRYDGGITWLLNDRTMAATWIHKITK